MIRLALKPATARRMLDACVKALRRFALEPGAAVHAPDAAWRSLSDTALLVVQTPELAPGAPRDPVEVRRLDDGALCELDLLDSERGARISLTVSGARELTAATGTSADGRALVVRRSGDGWVVVRGGDAPVRRAVLPGGQVHDASHAALTARDPRNSALDLLEPVATLQRPPPPPPPAEPAWHGELERMQAGDREILSRLDDVVARLPGMLAELKTWKDALAKLGEEAPRKAAEPKFCPHCGAAYRGTVKFCTGCGQPRKRA